MLRVHIDKCDCVCTKVDLSCPVHELKINFRPALPQKGQKTYSISYQNSIKV